MAAASKLRQNPREIAEKLAQSLKDEARLTGVDIAGPGFLNFTASSDFLAGRINAVNADPRLGCPDLSPSGTIILDFGGLNVAKAMHVGHLRSLILGGCLQRLFRFLNCETKSDIHLGDWGLQMGMLIDELSHRKGELPYFDSDFQGTYPENSPVSLNDLQEMYPHASARCKQDEGALSRARQATRELQAGRIGYRRLWEHFISVTHSSLKDDFSKLGIEFDLWEGESTVNDLVAPLVDRLKAEGIAKLSKGALIIDVEKDTDKKKIPPLLLLKSDGAMLYGTTDLATIKSRVDRFDPSCIVYVVDQRQHLHFEQVFRGAKLAGFAGKTTMEHVGFGTINGPDGKPFKTRSGGTMRLCDLLELSRSEAVKRLDEAKMATEFGDEEREKIAHCVGIASIKYADLMNHRLSDYIFDISRFTRFEGKTGPYVMYAAVRIKSVLRKARRRNLKPTAIIPAASKVETNLMLQLALFPDIVMKSYKAREPHHLCEYACSLAQEFNRFYHECPILREADIERRGSFLSLLEVTLATLEKVLDIMGIVVPERM
jgi:arginyl-tRNA synthetase